VGYKLARFYHVAKIQLEPNQIIKLIRINHTNENLPGIKNYINAEFEGRLTEHGIEYLTRRKITKIEPSTKKRIIDDAEPIIEIIFEYVRRSNYENRPSRFQSIFAAKHLKDAKKFRDRYRKSIGDIWEIECETYFKADMNIITDPLYNTPLVLSYLAHEYWLGHSHPKYPNPSWEYLLTPPVKVLRRIREDELNQLEDE
jgi:hypothetical protein